MKGNGLGRSGIPLVASAVIMLLLASPASIKAEPFRAPADAPAAWITFAGELRSKAEALLRSDDEVARRFQGSLEKWRASAPDETPQSIAVGMWVGADGRVERVAFAALSDAATDADLKTLLGRVSAGTPPPGMLQPVRLKLRLAAGG
jgi:hypothetical protein